MLLFALIASDCQLAVDLYPTRELSEHALTDAVADEPSWISLLDVAVLTDRDCCPCPN